MSVTFIALFLRKTIWGSSRQDSLRNLTLINIITIAICSFGLLTVIAVTNGLREFAIQALVKTLPEIELMVPATSVDEKSGDERAEQLQNILSQLDGVSTVSAFIRMQSLAVSNEISEGVELLLVPDILKQNVIAIKAEAKNAIVQSNKDVTGCAFVGKGVARKLQLSDGSIFDVAFEDSGTNRSGDRGQNVRTESLSVCFIYESGNPLLDDYSIISARFDSGKTEDDIAQGIEFLVRSNNPPASTASVVKDILSRMPKGARVSTWEEKFPALGRSLRLQNQFVLVVIGMTLLVCFSTIYSLLISTLSIRRSRLALLSSFGCGRYELAQLLFLFTGTIVVIGLSIGTIGTFVAANFLPSLIAHIADTGAALDAQRNGSSELLPFRLSSIDVISVWLLMLFVTASCSVLSFRRVSRIDPADELRSGGAMP